MATMELRAPAAALLLAACTGGSATDGPRDVQPFVVVADEPRAAGAPTADPLAVALAPDGSAVVAGAYRDEVVLGAVRHEAPGGGPASLVAAVDPEGTRWSMSFGGGRGRPTVAAVEVGADGDTWLAGSFGDRTLNLGGHSVRGRGPGQAFVARIGADGQVRWLRDFGGDGDDAALDLAVDGSGAWLLTAERKRRHDDTGGYAARRLDTEGVQVTAVVLDDGAGKSAAYLADLPDGAVLALGSGVALGARSVRVPAGDGPAVFRLEDSGRVRWARRVLDGRRLLALAADERGRILVGHLRRGDEAVTALDPDGDEVWTTPLSPRALAATVDGWLVVGWDGSGSRVTRLDGSGASIWSAALGGAGEVRVHDVSAAGAGAAVSVRLAGRVDMGAATVQPEGRGLGVVVLEVDARPEGVTHEPVAGAPAVAPTPHGWRAADRPVASSLATLVDTGETLVTAGTGGVVLRSADGRSWSWGGPVTWEVRALAAAGETLLAFGADGELARSEDGGRTWQLLGGEGPMVAIDALSGPAHASVLVPAGRGTALVDVDGAGEATERWSGLARLTALHADGDNVVAVGLAGAVLRADGDEVEVATVGTRDRLGVAGDGSTWLAWGPDGAERSADTGRTWQPLDPGAQVRFVAGAVDGERLALAGEGGAVLLSTDGGATWRRAPLAWEGDVRAMRWRGPTLALVGDAGLVAARTADGWLVPSSIRPGEWLAATWLDDRTALVVGRDGRAVRSEDGGRTWSEVDTGTRRDLYAVAVRDQLVVAVGRTHAIARSTDGGRTWRAQSGGRHETLTGVVLPGEEALAVGQDGGVLDPVGDAELELPYQARWLGAASDADEVWLVGRDTAVRRREGQWRRVRVPPGSWRTVALDGDDVLVGGDGLLQSSDGGTSWSSALADAVIAGVAWGPPALAVGRDGQVWVHHEGSWQPEDPRAEGRLGAVAVAPDGTALVAGRDGALLLRGSGTAAGEADQGQ